MFIILWLIIRSLYQAVLYKDLQEVERRHQVQTIEESLRLGFMYYMIAPTQENIKYLPELYERRIVVSRMRSFEILQAFNDPTIKAAFLGALDTVRYANKMKLYGFSLPVCKEPLLLRQYGIVFQKNSFLPPSFDDKLIVLAENGLIDYWLSEMIENVLNPSLDDHQPTKLTLIHLVSSFQVFLFGISVALLAFTTEKLSMKVKCLKSLF